jgi:hypothetical protein
VVAIIILLIIAILIEQERCFRCHREGHFANICYATKNIHGDIISDSDSEEEEYIEIWECSYCNKQFDTERGAKYHENNYCKKKYNHSSNNGCYKCGRTNHYANSCFSKFHINGYRI